MPTEPKPTTCDDCNHDWHYRPAGKCWTCKTCGVDSPDTSTVEQFCLYCSQHRRCAFCDKYRDEVEAIFTNGAATICNECVGRAVELMEAS